MKTIKMTFIPKYTFDDKYEFLSDIELYLAGLEMNGQLLSEGELFESDLENKDILFTINSIFDEDALNKKYNLKSTNEYLEKILKHYDIKTEIIGNPLVEDDECTCDYQTSYILHVARNRVESCLKCGDCLKSFPLYKLSQNENFYVTYFSDLVKTLDKLWMLDFDDEYSYYHLNNTKSKLFEIGKQTCNSSENVVKKPIYYYIFTFDENYTNCPICNNPLILNNSNQTAKCDKCKIIF